MLVRRLVFFGIMGAAAAGLVALMVGALAPGGWTVVKGLILAAFVPSAVWLGVWVGNAIPGFMVLVGAGNAARAMLPVRGEIERGEIVARTAILVTIRNEDMGAVLPPLGRLVEGLGDPGHFTVFLLSDTQDAASAAAEEAAVAACGFAVRYRRRAENSGFKAGNVMEFLDNHAEGFELALMLDADSQMSAEAVRRLVLIMQAAPGMGLVQNLIAGRPAAMAFPRLFQFGMRAGMRVWAVGQAFWQGEDGPYWGHNAIFRIAPFREHCRLEKLPDGSTILSHDQVEAARLRAAGWGVCVWADDTGSSEANPPAMPEFLHRDGRWLAGNLQYWQLLWMPGFRAMGRWQLVQAILLFGCSPLYVGMFLLAVIVAQTAPDGYPRAAMVALMAGCFAAYSLPKLLGYAETLLFPARRRRYGGGWRFAAGAASEIVFTLLLDAPGHVTKTAAMLRFMLGMKAGWLPQNRSDRGVGWGEAARLFWAHTLLGVVCFAALAHASMWAALIALPFAGGLLVAIPFCVVTASPGASAWLREKRIAALPEEV